MTQQLTVETIHVPGRSERRVRSAGIITRARVCKADPGARLRLAAWLGVTGDNLIANIVTECA